MTRVTTLWHFVYYIHMQDLLWCFCHYYSWEKVIVCKDHIDTGSNTLWIYISFTNMTYITHNSVHIIHIIDIIAIVRPFYVHICCKKHICWQICLLRRKYILMSWLVIIERMKKDTTTTFMFIYILFLIFFVIIAIYVRIYIYALV